MTILDQDSELNKAHRGEPKKKYKGGLIKFSTDLPR